MAANFCFGITRSCYSVDLLLFDTYRKLAHTANPSLDVMPFMCFIATLLWLQNFPSFAQAELLPIHAWSFIAPTGLVVMRDDVIDGGAGK
jgi:hypothetical protein